jgi:hypothetical protein
MKQLLIVAPHFPPVNAADMHRARVSLPYFREFGWQPHVLAVAAEHQGEMAQDERLLETLPADVPVTRTSAAPLWLTRTLGVGNVGLRALAPLHRAGARLIREARIDLAYFSTTVFASMALGPLWKRRYGVPFVLDMQDPWVSDYRPAGGAAPRGKHALASRLHGWLEPFTMRSVDGLVAVSPAYVTTLRARYPQIAPELCATIPFGASAADFDVARRLPASEDRTAPHRRKGELQAVSVGRGGDDLAPAATILFRAVAALRSSAPPRPVRFLFVGTDYAPAGQGRRSIAPVADRCGAGDLVTEIPERAPYFEALRRLIDADLLVVLGSADPQYSPSKVYPYLLARRPVVAILHEASPVVALLRRAGCLVVTFGGVGDIDGAARTLAPALASLLARLPFEPEIDDAVLAPFGARELTRQQCALFDAVLERHAARRAVPCLG